MCPPRSRSRAPAAAAAPPPPPPPAPAPVADDGTIVSGDQSRRRARVQGRRGNILTGPRGVTQEANLGTRTLLGG
jgi:hypothetical protein